jgi:hypothetical protein
MNIFERLVSGYPKGDVSPQDFMKPARENPRFQSWDERAQNSWDFGK